MFPLYRNYLYLVKRFKDTKEDNESCKSREGQYSGQKKKGKQTKTNNDLQNTTQKTKIEQHEPH
jgi:Sec-independent protein translocase protein TatA